MIFKELVDKLLKTPEEQPDSPCDPEIYKNGVQVLRFAGPRSWLIDAYVKYASKEAGVPIDWHFAGGRAVILCKSDDTDKASEALNKYLPSLSEAALLKGDYEVQEIRREAKHPPQPDQWPEGAIGWDPSDGSFMYGA